MELLLIIHMLAALFTIVFAVYTGFHIFHWYSVQHRLKAIKAKMMPLLIGKVPKEQIIEKLKKDGYSEEELTELYYKFTTEYFQSKTP
jgi:predicted membrane-bound spermidine synthase